MRRIQIQNLMQKDAPSKFSTTGFQKVWVVNAVDEQGQPITVESFVGKWNAHWQVGIAVDFEPAQLTSRQYQDRNGVMQTSYTLKAPPSARPAQYGGQAPQQGFAPQQPQFQQPQSQPAAPQDAGLIKRVADLETNMGIVMAELQRLTKPVQEVGAPPVGTGQPPMVATQATAAPATPFPANSTVQGGELLPPPPMYDEEIRQDEIPQ